MFRSSTVRIAGIAFLMLTSISTIIAKDPVIRTTMVRWDVDMPNAPKDKADQFHNSQEIKVTYASESEDTDIRVVSAKMDVRFFFANSKENKPEMKMESSIYFSFDVAIEKPISITISLKDKPPVVFTITKEKCRPSKKDAKIIETCFSATELTLPSYWQGMMLETVNTKP
jgi:hypothetical protein